MKITWTRGNLIQVCEPHFLINPSTGNAKLFEAGKFILFLGSREIQPGWKLIRFYQLNHYGEHYVVISESLMTDKQIKARYTLAKI